MTALFVQTLLLMAAAYFIGAALACLIRRSLFVEAPRPVPAERRVDPLPEIMERAGDAGSFRRDTGAVPKAAPMQPIPAAIVPVPTDSLPAQDLKRIRQIDAALETALNSLGVRRFEQIAAWAPAEVKHVGDALGLKRRISRENWIEQAQVLAKGGETYFAMRRARGEIPTAAPTPDEGESRSMVPPVGVAAAARASTPPDVAGRAAFAMRPASPLPRTVPHTLPQHAVPIRPAAPPARDNLLRISGIDAEVEQVLVEQGVTRYSQIAHWSPAEVERFEGHLQAPGRIGRENWIEQAQILSRGGDTRFSRQYDQNATTQAAPSPATAAAPPPELADASRDQAGGGMASASSGRNIGVLRSVRAEVYQNSEGAQQERGSRPALRDDLKRIRGIGVLIENRLNAMGVASYEQIANWTAADIDRISQSLDFKGRIERENWIEQARILASGGATEFSRRVDRGEMDTGRYRR
jgi:predicted flap endonuclease-1-like 5' DNA nuclease